MLLALGAVSATAGQQQTVAERESAAGSAQSNPVAFNASQPRELAASPSQAQRPNIVLVVLDDVGQMDLSVYNSQAPRTKNLDQLAAQGVHFRQALLTTSSCSPSRASLITGLYPSQTDAPNLHDPIPADKTTLAALLREQGYYTAALGKWHMGNFIREQFDTIIASSEDTGTAEWEATLANRPKDKPFFFWLAPHDGHLPYQAWHTPLIRYDEHGKLLRPWLKQFWLDLWRNTTKLNEYFHEIQRLDRRIGDLMRALEREGVRQQTLVIIISDNGPQQLAKGTLYERALLTPLIIAYPPLTDAVAGSAVEGLVSSVDIAPTIMELAGLPRPANFEGVSLRPMLENPRVSLRQWIYAEGHNHDDHKYQRLIRTERYAYKRNLFPNTLCPADRYQIRTDFRAAEYYLVEEIYDLKNDPAQQHNLIHQPPTELAALRNTLSKQFNRVNAGRPYPRLDFANCFDITRQSIAESMLELSVF